ncbi:MAG: STAS domain-containing protein [Ignavibacteria bacterium]|nr:STAS domain-containing protein [Ignavibacteria bacterium]
MKVGDLLIVEVNLPRTSIYATNEFKSVLENAIERGERKIIVDFTKCDFIDSTFLGLMVVLLKRLSPIKGELCLVAPNPNVKSSLELTRMNKIFKVFDDLNVAVNQLSA